MRVTFQPFLSHILNTPTLPHTAPSRLPDHPYQPLRSYIAEFTYTPEVTLHEQADRRAGGCEGLAIEESGGECGKIGVERVWRKRYDGKGMDVLDKGRRGRVGVDGG